MRWTSVLARVCWIALLAPLSACANTNGTGGSPTCQGLPGFANATAVVFPATFNLPPLPDGTVFTPAVTQNGGNGQYQIITIDACSPNQTVDLNQTTGKGTHSYLYAVPFAGWTTLNRFPAVAKGLQTCGVTNCFATHLLKPSPLLFDGPPQYFSLGDSKDNGYGLITYHLRFAAPPATPTNCGPNYDTWDGEVYGHHPVYTAYYSEPNGADPGIQFPPLTRIMGDNAAGTQGTDLCSAGSGSVIQDFMTDQFLTAGWQHVTNNIYCVFPTCWQQPNPPSPKYVESWQIGSDNLWVLAHHNPHI